MKLYLAIGAVLAVVLAFILVHKQSSIQPLPALPLSSGAYIIQGTDVNSDPGQPPATVQSGSVIQETNQAPAVDVSIAINGRALTAAEIQALTNQYGTVSPGNYWYDDRSGLYGPMGGPTLGAIAAGYNFGSLDPNASHGDTNVFINGREITQAEVVFLSRYLGQVEPGPYWLNANGDFGVSGSGAPLGNLYASSASVASNGASGGDNFWSTNFSAGNYNADNTQGYVSVPGEGPVGYGF